MVGVSINNNHERYLGLPSTVDKSKYNSFRTIEKRIWEKMNNWKNNFLSGARKEIILKAFFSGKPIRLVYSCSLGNFASIWLHEFQDYGGFIVWVIGKFSGEIGQFLENLNQ